MGQLAIEQDSLVTERILAEAPEGTKLFIATGYFNLTRKYVKTIVNESIGNCNILMAHPDVSKMEELNLCISFKNSNIFYFYIIFSPYRSNISRLNRRFKPVFPKLCKKKFWKLF